MIEFLAACVVAGTPLAFATVGELITEKTGNLNLGVEGMMLMGAVMGFFTGLNTANPFMALAAAALAGAGGALIYAFVTVSLKANQVGNWPDAYDFRHRLRAVCGRASSGIYGAV